MCSSRSKRLWQNILYNLNPKHTAKSSKMITPQRWGMPLVCFQCADTLLVCSETCQRHVPTLWWNSGIFMFALSDNLIFEDWFFRRRRAVFVLLSMPPTSQEGGVRGVVWLIQAPAWNQTCHSANDRCEALASPKGCFLCFCFCAPSIYPLNWI